MLPKILGVILLVVAAGIAFTIAIGILKIVLPIVAAVVLFYFGWRLLKR